MKKTTYIYYLLFIITTLDMKASNIDYQVNVAKEKKIDDGQYKRGTLSLPKDYERYLIELLSNLEKENPVSHVKKYEVIKGDASVTLNNYLKK